MNIVEPKRRGGIGVVLAIVALDFAGIGLTLPIIPRLLSEVAHTTDLGWRFGAFLSLYALMQFVFSPILGIWSDRAGRRPVLLCSLAGADRRLRLHGGGSFIEPVIRGSGDRWNYRRESGSRIGVHRRCDHGRRARAAIRATQCGPRLGLHRRAAHRRIAGLSVDSRAVHRRGRTEWHHFLGDPVGSSRATAACRGGGRRAFRQSLKDIPVGVVGSCLVAAADHVFGIHARRPGGRHDMDYLRIGPIRLDAVLDRRVHRLFRSASRHSAGICRRPDDRTAMESALHWRSASSPMERRPY